jgi:2-oxoglutarate dehydrogenase E2 component (dihydrolipoamide succinyltransferase)
MKVEMLMPQMGESIAEATVLKWLKGVGDEVKKDETILEISTDKVDSEIPAPATGVIVELVAQVGQTVPVKSVIAVIETEKSAAGEALKAAPSTAPAPAPAPAAPAPAATIQVSTPPPPAAPVAAAPAPISFVPAPQHVEGQRRPLTFVSPEAELVTENGVGVTEFPAFVGERFFSPVVKNLAVQYNISSAQLAQIRGTGSHGRLTKNDVLAFVAARDGGGVAAGAPQLASPAAAATATAAPQKARPEFSTEGIRVEPFDNMRKKIAEHMVRSKATSPHVYTVAEVDLNNVARWREANQKAFLNREGFKLSFTPFFLEAAAKALVEFPGVNASVEGENLILKKRVNLGCAVALGNTGLIVPVIKDADQLSLVGIARALNDLANRARNKKLTPDDIQGGTFTVTNPGVFGSIIGYPIINQPQLAILGVGAIKKRPVVVDNMIAIREVLYLTLSYDHRVIDGSLGGQFLNFIAKYLENWSLERQL